MRVKGIEADAVMTAKEQQDCGHASAPSSSSSSTTQTRRRQRQKVKFASNTTTSRVEHEAVVRERKRLAQAKKNRRTADKTPTRRVTPSLATKQQARNYNKTRATHTSRQAGRRRLMTHCLLVFCVVAVISPLYYFRNEINSISTDTVSSFFKLLHSSTTQQQQQQLIQQNDVIYFIPSYHLTDEKDLFSASFLTPVSTFLDYDTSMTNIQTPSEASLALFRKHHVQMTLDWLDFSLEHLSSWWDATSLLKANDQVAFHIITSKCYDYIRNIWAPTLSNNTAPMSTTIAVIAFEPLVDKQKPEIASQLSVTTLATCVASLIQAGFGRVVVVGYKDDDDEVLAKQAFGLLHTLVPKNSGYTTSTLSDDIIYSTQVAYVKAETLDVISTKTPINVVKGALTGLQKALDGKLTLYDTQQWLGVTQKRTYWKYVYLTEFDSILQTKPTALLQLKAALEEGAILSPHRIQILPHQYDLSGMPSSKNMVMAEGKFANVTTLNALEGGVCCDVLSTEKPWQNYQHCNSHWWSCGFSSERHDHSRLLPYDLIRLKPGMDIVSLAANHNGRKCIPKVNGVCSLPTKKDFGNR